MMMTRLQMIELTDIELDAVRGGIGNLANIVTQLNTGVQVGLAFGGLNNAVAQLLGQANISF
jgi:hypothetical protein